MKEKFLKELDEQLKAHNVQNDEITPKYEELFDRYVRLGQSEFDIIMRFGEPSDIVNGYIATHTLSLPDMDSDIEEELPNYLTRKETPKEEVKEVNTAPTTKAGLICNDIFFVGLGLVIAIAGIIALSVVSVLLTATSVYQMVTVWSMEVASQRVPGFFFALMIFAMTILFYFIIVWIAKAVIKFMKKYAKDHKENWAKAQ